MPISQSVLREKSGRRDSGVIKEANVQKNFSATTKKAFLCHSHSDIALVEGLIVHFSDLGVDLYVDWKDASMPPIPDAQTADVIKTRIQQSDVFLFLATENSCTSRWCPWEIGYADGVCQKIIIIPTSERNIEYGNEYLGLYPRLDGGTFRLNNKPGLFVWNRGIEYGRTINSILET